MAVPEPALTEPAAAWADFAADAAASLEAFERNLEQPEVAQHHGVGG